MIEAMKSSHITTHRRELLTPMEGTMVKGAPELVPFSVFIGSPSLQEGLGQNIAFLREFKGKMEDYTSRLRSPAL
jgi:hypothetical protein